MKHKANYSTLHKAFTFVMAALVFVLVMFMPADRNSKQEGIYKEQEMLIASATLQGIPALPTAAKPPLKLSILLFDLPELWPLLLLMAAQGIRDYQTILLRFFIQKINFVFVSTQAP